MQNQLLKRETLLSKRTIQIQQRKLPSLLYLMPMTQIQWQIVRTPDEEFENEYENEYEVS